MASCSSPLLFELPPPASFCFSSNSRSIPSSSAPVTGRRFNPRIRSKCRLSTFRRLAKAEIGPGDGEEEEYQVLMSFRTNYNDIMVLDTPKSKLLLLDSTLNVHSMINKGSRWTDSYWDEFATLPPLVPGGPIAIFGLGGGTAAHLILELWPSLQLEGWEIDEMLIHISRDYLELGDLEKQTTDGGQLNIHIGDVFSPDAAISGGYAGIIVDLFSEGKVLPQLEQPSTWLELYDKLKPNGRLMVNCGAADEGTSASNTVSQHSDTSSDGSWNLNATIRAMCKAFPGQVHWKKMPKSAGENYVALTGPLPDLSDWATALPSELKSSVSQWQTCDVYATTNQ